MYRANYYKYKREIIQWTKDLWGCFFPSRYYKYSYLGITWNIFKSGSVPHEVLESFIQFVDDHARPWWAPRFVLRLLHLFGNDNSIVRVRWWWAHKLHSKILNGILIQDIKTKWGTLRVYGHFDDVIYKRLEAVEKAIDPFIEIY